MGFGELVGINRRPILLFALFLLLCSPTADALQITGPVEAEQLEDVIDNQYELAPEAEALLEDGGLPIAPNTIEHSVRQRQRPKPKSTPKPTPTPTPEESTTKRPQSKPLCALVKRCVARGAIADEVSKQVSHTNLWVVNGLTLALVLFGVLPALLYLYLSRNWRENEQPNGMPIERSTSGSDKSTDSTTMRSSIGKRSTARAGYQQPMSEAFGVSVHEGPLAPVAPGTRHPGLGRAAQTSARLQQKILPLIMKRSTGSSTKKSQSRRIQPAKTYASAKSQTQSPFGTKNATN